VPLLAATVLQAVLLLQLVITYVTAQLYFADPEDVTASSAGASGDSMGSLFAVCINMIAPVYILEMAVRGVRRMLLEMKVERLLWSSDGHHVSLLEPTAPHGQHVFLSHDPSDDSQAARIKSSLVALVPEVQVFLHRENMADISKLEDYVRDCDVFVALVTDNYIRAASCRRELVAAVAAKKPVIVLQDMGPAGGKGPVTANDLTGQLDRVDCDTEQHDAIEVCTDRIPRPRSGRKHGGRRMPTLAADPHSLTSHRAASTPRAASP
jgi:hypothetical protein